MLCPCLCFLGDILLCGLQAARIAALQHCSRRLPSAHLTQLNAVSSGSARRFQILETVVRIAWAPFCIGPNEWGPPKRGKGEAQNKQTP